jgi:hypothetical protein
MVTGVTECAVDLLRELSRDERRYVLAVQVAVLQLRVSIALRVVKKGPEEYAYCTRVVRY